jgi:hypothetical protein
LANAQEAFQEFAKQFGPNDIYTQILLEVLFEELMKSKNTRESNEKKAN